MKKRIFPFLVFTIILFPKTFSQTDLSVLTLSQEAKENANAIVRQGSTTVIVEDLDRLTTQYKYVVTVLNKIGHDQFFNTYAFYDNDSKIKKISVKIYDAFGKEIKKYNKSKFIDVSAVSGGTLYADDRVMYIEHTPISYPYTYVFEAEKTLKTTGFIPNWTPLSSYYLGVQESTYRFVNNSSSKVRTKEINPHYSSALEFWG